jgi:hypothetical protein
VLFCYTCVPPTALKRTKPAWGVRSHDGCASAAEPAGARRAAAPPMAAGCRAWQDRSAVQLQAGAIGTGYRNAVRRFDAAQPSVQRRGSHAEQPACRDVRFRCPPVRRRRRRRHIPSGVASSTGRARSVRTGDSQATHGSAPAPWPPPAPRLTSGATEPGRSMGGPDVRGVERCSEAVRTPRQQPVARKPSPASAQRQRAGLLGAPSAGALATVALAGAPSRSRRRESACATQARTQPHCRSAPRVKAASLPAYATKERRRAHERGLRSGHDRNAQRGAPAARAAIARAPGTLISNDPSDIPAHPSALQRIPADPSRTQRHQSQQNPAHPSGSQRVPATVNESQRHPSDTRASTSQRHPSMGHAHRQPPLRTHAHPCAPMRTNTHPITLNQ